MFTPKPKNRKRRSSSRRNRSHTRSTTTRPTDSVEALREREYELHAQIGALEDVLANLTERENRQRQMRQENVLPPPEYPVSWGSKDHHRHSSDYETSRSGERYSSKPSKRKKNPNKNAGSIQFLILLVIAIVLAFWLFYTGG